MVQSPSLRPSGYSFMLDHVSSVLKALAQSAATPSQINPSLSPLFGNEYNRTAEWLWACGLTAVEHGPLGMELAQTVAGFAVALWVRKSRLQKSTHSSG